MSELTVEKMLSSAVYFAEKADEADPLSNITKTQCLMSQTYSQLAIATLLSEMMGGGKARPAVYHHVPAGGTR